MRFWLLALVLSSLSAIVQAESFVVADIRLEGLQRVSAGTVFEAFPVNTGEQVDSQRLVEASRRLFRSGLFDDVRLLREGNVLVIQVVELPTITGIEISGNKAIQTDMLLDGLKQSGLAEGLVFKRSTLERIALELERQYVSQGRYDARITTEVERLPRNRVALNIQVKEGSVASIEHINIVGNQAFSDTELLKQLQLKTRNFWSWYASDDKYSREKLSADLETLRSWYLDRGYIRFNIESTQVSLSPNKEGVYITISITEGEVYSVSDIKVAGNLVVPEEDLRRLILIRPEDTFSRQMITYTSELMSKRLGNEGYTFAKVDGIPKINDADRTVELTFFVEPGKRTYVRSINFTGNESTIDEVLRREMLQMEGGWASTDKIDAGKDRLNQLGFFKTVNVDTPVVAGTDDMIDVNYHVEEQLSGSLNFNIGYAGGSGMILGTSISQNNLFGTGNRMSLGVQKNDYTQSYNFSFLDPYYTIDGVSRGFNLFYRETDFSQLNTVSDYQTNVAGGNVTFGYPISYRQRLSFSLGYSNTEMVEGSFVPKEISDFVTREGRDFDEYTLGLNWRYNSLNRGLFPTAGTEHRVAADIAVPGSDLSWYKLNYTANYYLPLAREWSLRLRTDLGYGDGYGDNDGLPFFKNFRSGGIGSVRGYRSNSLGPKGLTYVTDSSGNPVFLETDRALGGNVLVETSLELIFPLPFIEDRRSVRSVVFVDAGNAFNTNCYEPTDPLVPEHPFCSSGVNLSDLRLSTGVGLTWVTAIGPLTFTYSFPLNEQDGDRTEGFEFSLGQVF